MTPPSCHMIHENLTSICRVFYDSNVSSGVIQNQSVSTNVLCRCLGNVDEGNLTIVAVPAYLGAYIAILNCCIFLTGVLGNVVVIAVVVKFPHMRTSINFYLANLSLADLLILLVCQPVAISEFFNRDLWHFGPVLCKLVPAIEHTVLHSSVFTILVINFERRNAICRPLSVVTGSVKSRQRARGIIPLIWLVSAMFSLPFFGMTDVLEVTFLDGRQGPVCIASIDAMWKQCFVTANFVLLFLLPVLLMAFLLIKMIRTLQRSNKFRSIPRHNSRSSLTSVFSRSDDGLRDILYHRKVLASSKHTIESPITERDAFSNIIEEENEDSCASLPDGISAIGHSTLRSNSSENEDDISTSLLETTSSRRDTRPMTFFTSFQEDNNKNDTASNIQSQTLTSSHDVEICEADDTQNHIESSREETILEGHTGLIRANNVSDPRVIGIIARFWFKRKSSTLPLLGPRLNLLDSLRFQNNHRYRWDEDARNTIQLRRKSTMSLQSSYISSHGSQIKILIAIFLYFVTSYLPIRVFILFQVFDPSDYLANLGLESYFNIFWTLRLIMYLHSAASPLIYYLMSSKFSDAIKTLLFSKRQRQKKCIASLPLTHLNMMWGGYTEVRQRLHSLRP